MIDFELNDKMVQSAADPSSRLLDVLRKDFGLLGPKEGCGEGECGACAVLIDGKLINSCLVAIGSLSGAKVMTIEGYQRTKRYEVLENTFAKAGAVQCGFCTPGMIMAAEALLTRNQNPTLEEIREAISGNLCRCTGYNMIVAAIKMAASEGEGLW
ncbi:(2Fe-2S)-binding protein [Anaerocolumna sp. AGMB13025]|uniref:(2Fe-2S)-binding protein n=1 Tax=Anaerocolumna sp. AGMB13025 TaxID=3039116 RepID=UPI0024203287|nr:(2Fe-2S)-binding protein [Anaerocolumna sp. AGMB13025]WFR57947.1 (2Fe-2S)-binding protein [Anaerocolumna sp. AGMB13025]